MLVQYGTIGCSAVTTELTVHTDPRDSDDDDFMFGVRREIVMYKFFKDTPLRVSEEEYGENSMMLAGSIYGARFLVGRDVEGDDEYQRS